MSMKKELCMTESAWVGSHGCMKCGPAMTEGREER